MAPPRLQPLDADGAASFRSLGRSDRLIQGAGMSGTWVLVAPTRGVGAFRVATEDADQGVFSCETVFRDDGLGTFADGACERRTSNLTLSERKIRFSVGGVEFVCWGERGTSEVSLLYPEDASVAVCVTDTREIGDLDAFDRAHVYLRFIGDPGSIFQGASQTPAANVVLRRAAPQGEAPAADRRRAFPGGISDGTILLLYESGTFAALRLDRMAAGPSPASDYSAHVEWRYRRDGCGRLDPADANVQCGESDIRFGRQTGSIKVGPFALDLDSGGPGYGYLQCGTDAETHEGRVFVCVTDLDGFTGLDCAAASWRYRRHNGDQEWSFRAPQ